MADESGEPIVVAAKAMDLPTDVVQRVLLFMNGAASGSRLIGYMSSPSLYREISVG